MNLDDIAAKPASGKREKVVVEPGFHAGEVRFSDEKPEYQKIGMTMDLDDGRRVSFWINAKQTKQIVSALGMPIVSDFDAESLISKKFTVELDVYTKEDGSDCNTFQGVKSVQKQPANTAPPQVKKDEIPF
tara:strand:+ start:13068 stop:13460 length:393 start_codon:yes stop_codon:yes gene_type:complete